MKRLARAAIWSVAWMAAALAARGAGLACLQACSGGLCSQAFCGPVASGGSCECFSGAVPWGTGGAYAAYCGAWGQPAPGCSNGELLASRIAARRHDGARGEGLSSSFPPPAASSSAGRRFDSDRRLQWNQSVIETHEPSRLTGVSRE